MPMKQMKYIWMIFTYMIPVLLCSLFMYADISGEKTITVSPSEVRLSGKAGTPLRTVVQIIPDVNYPFNIKKVYAESGKDIQYRLKTVNDPERKHRHILFVENIRRVPGEYVDTIHILTDSKVQPDIRVSVYGRLSDAEVTGNIEFTGMSRGKPASSGKRVLEERIKIINIRFSSGSSSIPASSDALAQIAGALKSKELENAKILIQGHTDSTGSSESNLALSIARAKSVMNVLVDTYGVDKERLSAEGLGESMPVTSNTTPAGRALNRRIEFVYLGDLNHSHE